MCFVFGGGKRQDAEFIIRTLGLICGGTRCICDAVLRRHTKVSSSAFNKYLSTRNGDTADQEREPGTGEGKSARDNPCRRRWPSLTSHLNDNETARCVECLPTSLPLFTRIMPAARHHLCVATVRQNRRSLDSSDIQGSGDTTRTARGCDLRAHAHGKQRRVAHYGRPINGRRTSCMYDKNRGITCSCAPDGVLSQVLLLYCNRACQHSNNPSKQLTSKRRGCDVMRLPLRPVEWLGRERALPATLQPGSQRLLGITTSTPPRASL